MKNIEDTQKALQATLTNERLFCNNVSLDTSELHPSVLPLVDCDDEFFNEAENCARTFRNTYQTSTTADRQSGVTCRFVHFNGSYFFSYFDIFHDC